MTIPRGARSGVVERLRAAGLAGRVLGDLLGLPAPPVAGTAIRCVRPEAHKHGDRSPSLVVNADGAGARCRACGWGGGLLAIARERLGVPDEATAAAELERRYLSGGRRGRPRTGPRRNPSPAAEWRKVLAESREDPAGFRDDPEVEDLLASYDGSMAALEAVGGGVQPRKGNDPLRLVLPLFGPSGEPVGAKARPALVRDDSGEWVREADVRGSRGGILGELGRLAAEPIAPVLLLEGGHDLLAVIAAGIARDHVRLALPGALRLPEEWAGALKGRDVVLALHHDEAGRQGTEAATKVLRTTGACVRTLEWSAVLDGLPGAKDAADVLRAGRRDALDQAVREAPGLVRWRSVEDLAEESGEEVPWVVEGLLARRTVTLLTGPPKSGKSTLTFALLRALERGSPFAGFAVSKTRAVILSEEEALTLHEKAVAFGVKEARFLTRREMRPDMTLADFLREGVREARRVGAHLLVLDTLPAWGRFGRDEEKDSGAMQAAMQCVLEAAGEGLAILVVHHTRKGGGEDGEAARGSSALVGAVDIALELRRAKEMPGPNFRTLAAFSRFRESPAEEQSLELRGREYVRQGSAAEAKVVAWKERVVDFLARATGPMTRDEVAEGVGGMRELTIRALKELVADGVVVRTGAGKRGDPHRYALAGRFPSEPVSNPSSASETTNGADSRLPVSPFRETAETGMPARGPETLFPVRPEDRRESEPSPSAPDPSRGCVPRRDADGNPHPGEGTE